MADRPQALSRQEIITIVLAVVIAACMVYLISNQVTTLKNEQANVATEETNLQQARNRLTSLIKLTHQEDLMNSDIATCERLLPSEPMEDGLINDLQGLSDQSTTHFTEIHFDKRVPKSGYTEMPIKIFFTGKNEGFLKLLSGIQGWSRAIRIDNVHLSSTESDQSLSQVKGEIDGAAFFRTQAQQPVNPNTKGGQ